LLLQLTTAAATSAADIYYHLQYCYYCYCYYSCNRYSFYYCYYIFFIAKSL